MRIAIVLLVGWLVRNRRRCRPPPAHYLRCSWMRWSTRSVPILELAKGLACGCTRRSTLSEPPWPAGATCRLWKRSESGVARSGSSAQSLPTSSRQRSLKQRQRAPATKRHALQPSSSRCSRRQQPAAAAPCNLPVRPCIVRRRLLLELPCRADLQLALPWQLSQPHLTLACLPGCTPCRR